MHILFLVNPLYCILLWYINLIYECGKLGKEGKGAGWGRHTFKLKIIMALCSGFEEVSTLKMNFQFKTVIKFAEVLRKISGLMQSNVAMHNKTQAN